MPCCVLQVLQRERDAVRAEHVMLQQEVDPNDTRLGTPRPVFERMTSMELGLAGDDGDPHDAGGGGAGAANS